MDYKADDLTIERRKVRTHLLGCKALPTLTKFSPVYLAKLHRVITEPYLEVVSTIHDVLGEMKMTADQFNEFLDDENLASLEKLSDILKNISNGTGIEIEFVTLPLGAYRDNENSPQEGTESESNTCTETQEISPSQNYVVSRISQININGNIEESCDNLDTLKESESNSSQMAESNSENKSSPLPLVFVVCKFLIVPTMHFMGISLTVEESKRKAAILFLKHVNSLKTNNLRKHNFVENFSSGDEAET